MRRVIALKKKQEEMDELVEKQYKLERIALEKKYLNLRLPYFEYRSGVVSGSIEPEVPADSDAAPGKDMHRLFIYTEALKTFYNQKKLQWRRKK